MAKKKEKKAPPPVSKSWLDTYSDCMTLMLCFFVALFNPDESSAAQMAALASAFQGQGAGTLTGGLSYSVSKLADMGASILSLPAESQGRALGDAYKKAISLFAPEIKSNLVRVTHDERGLVITLAGDAFFKPASARINVEQTRDILLRLGSLLDSPQLDGRKFRIEGHTDNTPTDPNGPWQDNWELSSARSIAVLHYLADLGVNENRFQVAGFADTVPVAKNDTPEGRAYNRRVDVIVLDEGHL